MKTILNHKKKILILASLLVLSIIGVSSIFASNAKVNIDRYFTDYLSVGENIEVNATVEGDIDGLPLEASNVIWTTSDPAVIAFNNSYTTYTAETVTLTAKGSGRATIRASYYASDGITEIASSTRDIYVTFIMNGADSTIVFNEGENSTIFTNFNSELQTLDWKSSNPAVVAVNDIVNSGSGAKSITAMAAGKATITATTPEGQNNSLTVIVRSKANTLENIIVEPSKITALSGYTNAAAPNSVRWVVTDSDIADVDAAGNVTGKGAGVTTVYFYPDESNLNGAFVNIKVNFGIQQGDIVMSVGDEYMLNANTDSPGVNWTSSDTSVASVTTNGLVKAVKSGTATIKASLFNTELFPGEFNQESTITVKVIDSFALDKTEAIIFTGDMINLTALVTDKDASVTWLSSNDAIATVQTDLSTSQKASVTGLRKGTATITAVQNINGLLKYAYCEVSVNDPVVEVDIFPNELEVNLGSQYPLVLIFNPELTSSIPVTWVSSDTSIATVNNSGVVTGVKGGDAVISVITNEGIKVASAKVHVRQPVTGITLSQTLVNTSMSVGYYQLGYSITPVTDGVNDKVTWTSSNTSVVTVSPTGLVTFIAPGKATVIAKTVDIGYSGNLIATCEFYINEPVTSISIDYTDITMRIGETFRLTGEVLPENASNKNIIWSSSNTAVATVDQTGMVRAVTSGSAAIIAQSEDSGQITMCNVNVYQPVTGIKLNTNAVTVRKGTEFWLNATITPSSAINKTVSWTSSNTAVATVDQTGKVTTVSPGSAVITVTSLDGGLIDRCSVTVTEPVTGITLNYTKVTMYAKEKLALIATVTPIDADNKKVSYISSDTEVATVDENGIVTGIRGGKTIIIATTEERGLIASCEVEVYEYVSSLSIDSEKKYLNLSTSRTLLTTVGSETATNRAVVWTSSNSSVISVDKKGMIVAKKLGTATITARAADGSGMYDSKTITVINPVNEIKVEPDYVTIIEGNSIRVKTTILPNNATIKTIDWSSSNPDVATVDYNGMITGIQQGICYVYAKSTDENDVVGVIKVTVNKAIPATAVVINAKEVNMLPGQTRELSARVRPSRTTDSIKWVSANTSVATVSKDGVVTAKRQGNTEVYCISDSGVESVCEINVLAMSAFDITVEQYDSYFLDVHGATENIIWFSNNLRIATVANGKVTGRTPGTTTILARVNGQLLYCKVTVKRMGK